MLVLPEAPIITYNNGRSVYDGEMISKTCTSQTKDPTNTEVIWIQNSAKIEGEVLVGANSVSNTIITPAILEDSLDRYECHVIHKNLLQPLIEYSSYVGMFIDRGGTKRGGGVRPDEG